MEGRGENKGNRWGARGGGGGGTYIGEQVRMGNRTIPSRRSNSKNKNRGGRWEERSGVDNWVKRRTKFSDFVEKPNKGLTAESEEGIEQGTTNHEDNRRMNTVIGRILTSEE